MARHEVAPYVGPQLAEAIISQEAFAGVDNMFDKQYASVGYMGWVDGSFSGVYYPSPGRTYKAGLSCRF